MAETLQFDPSLTINEIVALHPQTIPVFNRFGMDTCCGGGVTIDEAARRDGVDANEVIAELDRVLKARRESTAWSAAASTNLEVEISPRAAAT